MARRVEDNIGDVIELRDRFISNQLPILKNLGVDDISEVKRSDNGVMWIQFISRGNVTDRITYRHNGMECDHVVKGLSLNDLYRDMEYMVVNYIFGLICR